MKKIAALAALLVALFCSPVFAQQTIQTKNLPNAGVVQNNDLAVITRGGITYNGILTLPWGLTQGGTGSTSAAGARSALGLGTMALQNSNSVAITGGTITGVSITGNINLGASASATNPRISGDPNGGFYSAGAGKVDVAIGAANVAEWTNLGMSLATPLTFASGGVAATSVTGARSNLLIPIIDSGISTGTISQTTTLQAVINALIAQAATNTTTLGIPAIQVAEGIYTFSTGLSTKPWIKLSSVGSVEYDFTSLGTTGTAFSVFNNGSPDDILNRNAANMAPFIGSTQGGTYITGPGNTTSSIGIDLGNTSSDPNAPLRHAAILNTTLMRFGTCLKLRAIDVYGINFKNYHLEDCGTGISTEASATNINSGERLNFDQGTIASSTTGVYINVPGLNFNFGNHSFDFITGNMLMLDTAAKSEQVDIHDSWFEGIDGYIVYGAAASYSALNLPVILTNNNWVPSNDTRNAPYKSWFGGRFNLAIKGLTVIGFANASNAAGGMFLIDSNVRIDEADNIRFNDKKQMIATQTLLNNDSYFNQGTVGNNLITQPMNTWRVTASSNASAVVANDQVWTAGGATQSIKVTASGSSGSYAIISDRFPVVPGARLIADVAAYGGASTGTDEIELQFVFTSDNAAIPSTTGALTSGNTLAGIYGDMTDPAYTGNRLWWCKMPILPESLVPPGFNYAQIKIQVSNMSSGDNIWLGFAGSNHL